MDMSFTPEEERFRKDVRAFLDSHLHAALRRGARLTSGVFAEPDIAREWQRILDDKGWLVYHWPESAGGPGWTPIQRFIFEKECAIAGAPALPAMSLKLVGPVIYTFGTEAQKQTYLQPLRRGDHFWAQGFSEPGSGSDLASLKTRAIRDADHYIVNGAKTWTTQAQYANKLFCLVRTDSEVKAQRGISFLLIDMEQRGVTVRPILSASGDHEVNEVFLDDVRVPVFDLVGEEGQGWSIAKFLLDNERGGAGCFGPGLVLDVVRLRSLARALPSCRDGSMADAPLFRDRLARLAVEAEALELTELRIRTQMAAGREPGLASLSTKLIASEIRQGLDALAVDLFGYDALQLPVERPFYGDDIPAAIGSDDAQVAAARYLNGRAWSIFGGTSEIQLNIIAKAALGLSGEVRA